MVKLFFYNMRKSLSDDFFFLLTGKKQSNYFAMIRTKVIQKLSYTSIKEKKRDDGSIIREKNL